MALLLDRNADRIGRWWTTNGPSATIAQPTEDGTTGPGEIDCRADPIDRPPAAPIEASPAALPGPAPTAGTGHSRIAGTGRSPVDATMVAAPEMSGPAR